MKYCLNIFLLFVFAYFVPDILLAQSVKNSNECKNILKEITRNNHTIYSNRVLSFSYTTDIVYNEESGVEPKYFTTKIEIGKGYMHLKSEYMEIYQDKIDVFIIIPSERVVIRTITQDPAYKSTTSGLSVENLTDSLINIMQIKKCEKATSNVGNTLQLISMASPYAPNVLHEWWYDLTSKKINKTIVRYDKKSDIKMMTNKYSDFKYADTHSIKGQAWRKILDSKGNLLKKYQGYTYIDNKNEGFE